MLGYFAWVTKVKAICLCFQLQMQIDNKRTPGVPRWGWALVCSTCKRSHTAAQQQLETICMQRKPRSG
jgi:hypothetical protein